MPGISIFFFSIFLSVSILPRNFSFTRILNRQMLSVLNSIQVGIWERVGTVFGVKR